jgi:hypothetical protein
MKGSVYQRCFCRDPQTRRSLGRKCPLLKKKGHAAGWFFRYDAPRGGGAQVTDRGLKIGGYLDQWLTGRKLRLKPRTYESYDEAVSLYFKPSVGHLRLVDLRDHHLQDLVTAMMQINRPLPDEEKPSELAGSRGAASRDRLVAVPRPCTGW